MNQKYTYLFNNVGILTISNFSSKILVFLLVPLYTSVLSTEDVGVYDLVVSTISLLFPIFTLNIVDAVMRFLMDKNNSKKEVASIGIRIVLYSIIPMFLSSMFISKIGIFSSVYGIEYYIFIYYLSNCFQQFLIQFAKGIEKVSAMGIAGTLGTITTLLSNLAFLLGMKLGLRGFFIANILGQAIPALYLFFSTKLWKYIHFKKINKDLQREMLVYCVPLIATTIGWWVNSAFDKYVVSFVCGIAANGLLSVSYKIPQIINTLQSIFTQAWQISAIKEYGEKDTAKFYGQTFSTLNLIMSAACSWLILLAKPIGHILYQKEFYIAWQYVPFLLLASVLNSASGFLGPILSAKKASKPMAMSAIYGVGANVILNLLLVYLIGIQGATIATMISSSIIYIVRKHAVKDEIKIEGYKTILITWILLCVQAIFEIYTSLWWVEVILMIGMCLLNWNKILEMIKMGKNIIHKILGAKTYEDSCDNAN